MIWASLRDRCAAGNGASSVETIAPAFGPFGVETDQTAIRRPVEEAVLRRPYD